jgi:hypothetical protein
MSTQIIFHNVKGHYFLIMMLFGLFIGCKNAKEVSSSTTSVQKKEIEIKYCFGKGGGFTGVYEEYSLSETGKIYKRDFSYGRDVYLGQLTPIELELFLEKTAQLSLEGVIINEPGNISTYIEIREGTLSINKLVWGAQLYYPPNEIADFHKEMFDKLSKINK